MRDTPLSSARVSHSRILSGQDTKKFTVQLNGYYVDRISQGVISDDEAREQIKQQEDNSDDEGSTNEFWDSWSDIDFQGTEINYASISIYTDEDEDEIYEDIKSMPMDEFFKRYGGGDTYHGHGPSFKYFNRALIEERDLYCEYIGTHSESGSYTITFEVGADYTFDPSKLVFHTDGIWHGVFLRAEYIVGFGYDDKEAEIIEHGEGHWEASGGLPELAYFTVCGSAKWEFAAGEAIVRWWKCVLAKRRFAELRRF